MNQNGYRDITLLHPQIVSNHVSNISGVFNTVAVFSKNGQKLDQNSSIPVYLNERIIIGTSKNYNFCLKDGLFWFVWARRKLKK